MINAIEARRKSALRGTYKECMDMIESRINESIEAGLCHVVIDFDDPDKELIQMLTKELTELGYKIDCIPSDPLPTSLYEIFFHMTISWE